MAKKRKKKNARRKGRTAAQKAATRKLVARNKRSNPKRRTKKSAARRARSNPKRSAARRRRSSGASMRSSKRRTKRKKNPAASNPKRRSGRRRRRNPKLDYMTIVKPVLFGGLAAGAAVLSAYGLKKAPLGSVNKMILGNVAAGVVGGALVGMLSPTAGIIVAAAFLQRAGQLGADQAEALYAARPAKVSPGTPVQQMAGMGDIVEKRYLQGVVDDPYGAIQGIEDDDAYRQQHQQAGY